MCRFAILSSVWLGVLTTQVQAGCGGGPPWGEAKDGVATSLTLVTAKPTLGQPLLVKLEMRNTGTAPAKYDSQQAAVNGSLIVKGPDDAKVSYIGRPVQTLGGDRTLKVGETIVIFTNLDINSQYHLARPGKHTIQFRGGSGLPTSNVLTVTLADAPLSDYQKLFGTLQKVTPAGWNIADSGGSIMFISSPTGLKADVASITLFFMKEPTGGPKPQRGQPTPINLGQTTLGQAWLTAESQKAIDRWADYEKVVGEQVKAFKK
jgi:hypothetical protein